MFTIRSLQPVESGFGTFSSDRVPGLNTVLWFKPGRWTF